MSVSGLIDIRLKGSWERALVTHRLGLISDRIHQVAYLPPPLLSLSLYLSLSLSLSLSLTVCVCVWGGGGGGDGIR